MRIKKLVSAFSALAITVTAIAGLAVTASAADTYNILYGTKVEEEGIVTVNPQNDFTGDNSMTLSSDFKLVDKTFAEGTALNANSDVTTNFKATATYGKVYLSFTVGGSDQNDVVQLLDSDGTVIIGSYRGLSNSASNSTPTALAVIGGKEITGQVYNARGNAYEITATIDIDMNEIEYEVVAGSGGSGGKINKVATVASGTEMIDVKDVAGLKVSAEKDVWVDHLLLYHQQPEVQPQIVKYTVKYVDSQNNPIKAAAVRDAVAGGKVSAMEEDFEDVVTTEYTYSYNEDLSTPSITLSADKENVINLVFDSHAAKEIPVTAKSGETVIATDSISSYIDYDYSYGPYKYIYSDTEKSYYKYDGEPITGTTTEDSAVELTYTKVDSNIVWYAEAETLSSGLIQSNINYSGGAGSAMPAYNNIEGAPSIGTFAPGLYKATVYFIDQPGRGLMFRNKNISSMEDNIVASFDLDSASTGVLTVEFTLEEATELAFTGRTAGTKTNQSANFDYVMIEKIPQTASAESVPVLDDDQPVKGVKAFKATGTFSGGEQVTWNIMATINGEPKTGTETFTIPNVEAIASLGLIVDNIPDGIYVTATLSY